MENINLVDQVIFWILQVSWLAKSKMWYRLLLRRVFSVNFSWSYSRSVAHPEIFWGDQFGGWALMPPLYSPSWKCSLDFVYIVRTNWNFLIKFWSSDPSFNRNFLRSLYLKFKTSVHAYIAITYYYVLFTNFLSWYEF